MSGRLVAVLVRRSRTTRRLTLAALVVIGLLVVASALTPARHPAHRPVGSPAVPMRTQPTATSPGSRPISPDDLVGARRAAARFLAGYLPYLYGRESARSIAAVTPGFRLQMSREPAVITPVERRRRPRVVSLSAVGQAPTTVLATALIADGGATTYALRIKLRSGPDGWLVGSVDG